MLCLVLLCEFDDSLKFLRPLGPNKRLAMLVVFGEVGLEKALQFLARLMNGLLESLPGENAEKAFDQIGPRSVRAGDSRRGYRLARHPMMPLLIASPDESVDKAVASKMALVMDETNVSATLLRALLRRKRVLVIVDGVSELLEATSQKAIRADDGARDTRALVVTSRLPTNLADSLVVRPQNVTLAFLDRILDNLIAVGLGSGKLNGDEREKLRGHLKGMMEDVGVVSEWTLPMIFLKLMIDRAAKLLEDGKSFEELPRTLTELVNRYTEDLLRVDVNVTATMVDVRVAAKVYMSEDKSPASRSEARYLTAGLTKERLVKLVTAGLLIQTGETGDPFYKFAMDPVAEQLDANRVIIEIRDGRADELEVARLLARWDDVPKDFIQALQQASTPFKEELREANIDIFDKLWSAH